MKKVININFQGRVIPIEETAFELLKQYIESLRRYFADEEGREEIINDIQDRIGELFNDHLKGGATCITDQDLESIIDNMGRPADLEAAEEAFADQGPARNGGAGAGAGTTAGATAGGPSAGGSSQGSGAADKQESAGRERAFGYEPRGRLYRNDKDKVLGGVCSGFANYLQIDPVIVRILFVLLAFGSFGVCLIIYFVLWVALPAQGLEPNVRKRLYRNPDDMWLGGVCGGIAAYLNIETWIPRLIFAMPLIFGLLVNILHSIFWSFNEWPTGVFSGFGGTLFIIYVILWAILPLARTASEKLEMKGAKIDLESIRSTVQEELQSVKDKAGKVGQEISSRAQAMGEEFSAGVKSGATRFAKEAGPAARTAGYGIFRAIGVLFKIFFLFIAGVIAFALLMALIAICFGTIGSYSVSSIFIAGFWQHFFLWATLCLFLGIPVVAIFLWIIRIITGRRSQTTYLRYVFGTLWLLGLVSALALAGLFFKDKRRVTSVSVDAAIAQPVHNRLVVKVPRSNYTSDDGDNWDWGIHMDGLLENDDDTVRVYLVRLNVSQSNDALYHADIIKTSRGNSIANAAGNANRIRYDLHQEDSVLYIPKSFVLGTDDHFRFQAVKVNIEVPVGKHIYLDESLDGLKGYTVGEFAGRDFWNDDEGSNDRDYSTGVDYVMTNNGLQRADGKKLDRNDNEEDHSDEHDNPSGQEKRQDTSTPGNGGHNYRYHAPAPKPSHSVDSSANDHKQVSWKKAASADQDKIESSFYRLTL